MNKEEIKQVLQEIEKEKNVEAVEESSIDWQDLLSKAWKGKKFIITVTVVFMFLGLISALTMTRLYTSKVTLVPELGKSTSSSLSSISSMLGLGGMTMGSSADAYHVTVYPEVVASTPFVAKMFDMRVTDPKKGIDTTLIGYLSRERFSIGNVIGYVTKPIFSLFSNKEEETKGNELNLFHLTKEQDRIVKTMNKAIQVDVDKKTGETTIQVTMDNPVVAATVADTVCKHLREYIVEYRTRKAREDLENYKKIADESYQRYLKASKAYAYYQDHNRGLILNAVISEGSRLSNELQIASQLYQQMKLQAEMARGKVIDEKPVFAIIQPATVPLLPQNSRAKVLLIWTFVGFVLSCVWVLYGKEYWQKGKTMLNEIKSKA
ncbi:MAG: Wzz/FepE/Etk N-terminal domain-containing protein [Prevotellaceae bacterium]|nr:Wzz/FepE/Etk N-terminal domain-containing protein [Prevotellaceae bacterium]